jgi:hypothetical protein
VLPAELALSTPRQSTKTSSGWCLHGRGSAAAAPAASAAADSKPASASFDPVTPPPPPRSVTVSFEEGSCQPPMAGIVLCVGQLDVTLTNFPSGGAHTVVCFAGTGQQNGTDQTSSVTSTGSTEAGTTKGGP